MVVEAVPPPSPAAPTYDPRWFELLDRVEDRHFWFAARRRVVAALARDVMRDAPAGSWVLEIGCGTGGLLAALQSACPDSRVIGMDLHREALDRARRRSSAALIQADAVHPPFGVSFRLIGLFDVIEHLPDDAGLLRQVRTMLAPLGSLLVTVPAHPRLWSYFDEASHHRRRYTTDDLRSRLHAAGFRVDYLSQFMAPLLPIMWLRRRAVSRKRDPAGELGIVPGINALMNAALAIEAPLIRRRRQIPFGTSLVAVARKGTDG